MSNSRPHGNSKALLTQYHEPEPEPRSTDEQMTAYNSDNHHSRVDDLYSDRWYADRPIARNWKQLGCGRRQDMDVEQSKNRPEATNRCKCNVHFARLGLTLDRRGGLPRDLEGENVEKSRNMTTCHWTAWGVQTGSHGSFYGTHRP